MKKKPFFMYSLKIRVLGNSAQENSIVENTIVEIFIKKLSLANFAKENVAIKISSNT